MKEQLSGANGLVARLEAAEDESQLKIKQLESKRDSFKRQANELQRQLDSNTEASNIFLIEQSFKRFYVVLMTYHYFPVGEGSYEKGDQCNEGETNGYGATIHQGHHDR